MNAFSPVERIIVTAEGHALHGKRGKVIWRLYRDGSAWVQMDELLPNNLRSFTSGDSREKWVKLFPQDCTAEGAK